MNESHFARNVLLTIVGLAVVGAITIGIFELLSWILWPIIVGALVVGGGYLLVKRASNRSLGSGRSRRIGR